MHFCNDERATVTAEQKRLAGDSFKQTLVMTKLGALWRELPEARKATYNQKAKEDKARYDAALKAAGVLTKAEKKAQGPKRPLSAYMLVMTKLGEEWRGVGDKSKYEAMAAADKASKA